MSTVWSPQQDKIFRFFADGRGHLIVRARAGTGKTTTILEGINYAPERSIWMCAFNKKIADELNGRLRNPRAKASTIHSTGYRLVQNAWSRINVERDPAISRADLLAEKVCGAATPDPIKRLVSKLHTKAREIAPHARRVGSIEHLMFQFECEPDDSWAAAGYDAYYVESKALEAMELAATVRPEAIDFADMIYLPVRNHWMVPMYDLVVVDEAQDMTVAQLEIARGVLRPGGRIVVVGDDRQAIYGFRGADSGSLDRLKLELNATELGLTVTYRCGHAIVDEAKKLVPDFEAGPNNGAGQIIDMGADEMLDKCANGDFILSRINAPLVETALALLKRNKRARIAGKDIGGGLKALIKKVNKMRTQNVEVFLGNLEDWRRREADKWQIANKPSRVEQVNDKAAMLVELAEDAESVQDIERKIEALFTDYGLGQAGVITCSSVHRAKGLEADRVFVLAHTLKDRTKEEQNIQYVAITRAKKTLVWVTPFGPPKPEPVDEHMNAVLSSMPDSE